MADSHGTPTSTEADELAAAVKAGLVDGSIKREDVERLVSPHPRDLSSLLVAVGVCIAYAGSALLYGVNYSSMPDAVGAISVFIFPLLSLGTALWFAKAGRAVWLQEAAFGIGYVSLAGAVATALVTIDPQTHTDAWIAASAGMCAALIALFIRIVPRPVVVSYWALLMALGTATIATAASWGIVDEPLRWVFLGLAVASAAIGVACLGRGNRRAGAAGLSLGAGASYTAIVLATSQYDTPQFSIWHVLMTLIVVCALLGGVYLGLPELAVAGGFGALLWLSFAISLINENAAWGIVVIAFGLGLSGATAAIVRRRNRSRQHPPTG